MTAGNHVMQRRTGGPFSRVLASRSPVPADHYRSAAHRHTTTSERFMRATFSIRALLLLTTIASLSASMVRTSDWIAAIGFCGCAAMFGLAKASRHQRIISRTLTAVAIVIGWFSIIDYSYVYEWCKQCDEHRFIHQVRLCGLPVWNARGSNHVNNLSRLRRDLGVPCKHTYEPQHLVRAWGLVYCARPCSHITCCLTGDPEYYDYQVSKRAKQFARDNPNAAQQLCHRIINNEDYDEMHSFITTMKKPDAEWNVDGQFNAAEQRVEP